MSVFVLGAPAEREPIVLLPVPHTLDQRLVVVGVAAEARQVDRERVTLARRRRDRIVHRVVDQLRRHLADDALAALSDEQRIAQERIPREDERIGVHVADFGDAYALIAVVRVHPRETGERESKRHHGAGRLLRELADVPIFVPEQIEAARNVPVEEEGFGEGELIILGARSGLDRQRETFATSHEIRRRE